MVWCGIQVVLFRVSESISGMMCERSHFESGENYVGEVDHFVFWGISMIKRQSLFLLRQSLQTQASTLIFTNFYITQSSISKLFNQINLVTIITKNNSNPKSSSKAFSSITNLSESNKMWAKVNQRVASQQYERERKPRKSSSSQLDNESEQPSELRQQQKRGRYSYSDSGSEEGEESVGNKRKGRESDSSSQSQQESEQDSLEQDSRSKARKLESLRQQSDEEQQQQQSIDYIEERIKKLQKDLEQRLDKHKAKPKQKTTQSRQRKVNQRQNSQESGRIVSMRKQPPVPPKKREVVEEDNGGSLPETQINFKTREKPADRDDKGQDNDAQSKKETPSEIVVNKKKQVKENSQDLGNLLPAKKGGSSSVQSPIKGSKKRIKSSNIVYQRSQPQLTSKPTGIEKDLKRLNKEISELKKQNKGLRQELSYYKKKKKPAEQVQKLKELSQHDTKKLQKQLQLLKVLQRLQNKLKNSIERKLGKGSSQNKMTKQAALLHKGLPSNILG